MLSSADSLRTIDELRHGTLIPSSSTMPSTSMTYVHANTDNNISLRDGSTIHVIDSLLTTSECEILLHTSCETYGFSSLNHSFTATDRQADRLCIIDTDLANLIWARLGPLYDDFRFDGRSDNDWSVLGVNECCRVSQYRAPSVGFSPHFDTPYVAAADCRSALSIVVYLNGVGATEFYDVPLSLAKGEIDIAGLTTSEEIVVRGGLDQYTKYVVKAKQGRCVIFRHDVLHAGAPITEGTKYVLRTDIIFRQQQLSRDMNINTASVQKNGMIVDWFREAQNQELDGHVKKHRSYMNVAPP